jgi:hypothetical protein
MAKLFELNLADYNEFQRFMRKSPRTFQAAAAEVMNSAGFGIRKIAIRNVMGDSTVRNARFIKSSMRVKKTRAVPIGRQVVVVGSVAKPRFTGWEEQETGKSDNRKRTATLKARKRAKKRQIVRKVRFRDRSKWPTPSNFKKGLGGMLYQLSRSGSNVPFVIPRTSKLRSGRELEAGVWRFGRGKTPKRKLELLHRFKAPKDTKKTEWMTRARSRYLDSVDPSKRWARAIRRIIQRRK